MHIKIVKIAIFLLHSKALNAIINHIFTFAHKCAALVGIRNCLFARSDLKDALKE